MKVEPFFVFGTTMVLYFLVIVSLIPLFTFALEFSHKTMWGEKGVSLGQFRQVTGIGIDSANNVYVADFNGYSTKMIQKLTPNGTYILGFGILGNGPQYFTHPSGIAIDSKDNIFVADFGNPNYAVKEFDKNGTFNRSFGSFGLGPGQFINPGGLGVDQEDNVYATDFGEKNNVQKI